MRESPPGVGRCQRGVALIAALIVVFLATAAAVTMAERQLFDLRRTENLLRLDQALIAAQGVEAWALGVLREDARAGRTDHLRESWANALPSTRIAGGTVTAVIREAGGCFNLNNLVDGAERSEPELARFRRLLQALAIEPQIANAVVDWIDADLNTTIPGGAEDDYYSRLDPPYRSANRPLAAVSELLNIHGIDTTIYARLRPNVCALPRRTAINVNTVEIPVLMSLTEGLSRATAERVVATRTVQPFRQVADFLQALGVTQAALPADNLGVSSHYFEVTGRVAVGTADVQTHTLIARDVDAEPRVLARRIGREGDD